MAQSSNPHPELTIGELDDEFFRSRDLQAKVYRMLRKSSQPRKAVVFDKISSRLSRWSLALPAGWLVARVIRRFNHIRGKSKPAHIVAYFKLLMNAWHTSRRFRYVQNRSGSSVSACLFCKQATDCIEHLPHCPLIKGVFLANACSCSSLLEFMALDAPSFPLCTVRKVKLIAAVYAAHNSLRFSRLNSMSSEFVLACSVSTALNV